MDRDLFTAAYVPKWGEQLESLADLAMKEPWRFRNPAFPRKHADYIILEKYINGIFTAQVMAYQRAISQQEADARFFIRSGYACFHTGLLTKRYKDIFGYLERNRNDWADQAYVLRGFVDDSHPFLKKVDLLPQKPLADIRAEEFGFRPDWPIRVNVGHILDDSANLERIPEPARSFPNLPLLLQTGVEIARKTAEFIPSMVVPQLYGGAIQHLLPICLNDPNKPDLAMRPTSQNKSRQGKRRPVSSCAPTPCRMSRFWRKHVPPKTRRAFPASGMDSGRVPMAVNPRLISRFVARWRSGQAKTLPRWIDCFGSQSCSVKSGILSTMVSFSDFTDSEEVEMLLEGLAERGFECEAAFPVAGKSMAQETDQADDDERDPDAPQALTTQEPSADTDGYALSIEIPLTGFTPDKLDNLTRVVNAKAPLIRMALGVNDLPIQIHDDRIAFPWFSAVDPQASDYSNRMAAYQAFITLLCQTALNKVRVNAKERETDNPKFSMRVWLISLGMNDLTVKALRKLKDASGQYLWQPSLTAGTPDTLLNRPVYTSGYVPTVAAGARTVAFGDFSYYWVADRQGRSFKRLNELFAATGQVGFIASQRVDGKLILPEAVKVLQQKAS